MLIIQEWYDRQKDGFIKEKITKKVTA